MKRSGKLAKKRATSDLKNHWHISTAYAPETIHNNILAIKS